MANVMSKMGAVVGAMALGSAVLMAGLSPFQARPVQTQINA